jgi:hypothetical protein
VSFRKDALWAERKTDDEVVVEIFEHWLERP